jgi:hypothetical protein
MSRGPPERAGRVTLCVRPSEVFVAAKSLEETWRYLELQGEETPRRHDGQFGRRVCK